MLFEHPDQHNYTWQHPRSRKWHVLDYVLIQRKHLRKVRNTRVYPGIDCWSDHKFVGSDIDVAPPPRRRFKGLQTMKRRKANVRALRGVEHIPQPDCVATGLGSAYPNISTDQYKQKYQMDTRLRDAYTAKVAEELASKPQSNDINEEWEHLKASLARAVKGTVGYRRGGRDPDWWAESQGKLAPIIKQKAVARQAYEQAEMRLQRGQGSEGEVDRLKASYRQANNKAKRAVEEAREAWWTRMGNELTAAFERQDSHVLFSFWKKLNLQPNSSRGTGPIRDQQGQLLTEAVHQRERWRQHFSSILNIQSTVEQSTIDSVPQRPVAEWLAEPPKADEVEWAVRKLAYNKTAGADEITAEMLKAGGQPLLNRLHYLASLCWAKEQVPKEWVDPVVVPVPKKGDRTVTDNWRGISLLSVAGKAFTKIMEKRLSDFAEKLLAEAQAGFRRNRGCTDMIFVARLLFEKAREHGIELFACFFDLTKAYDTVNRNALWQLLLKYGIPVKFVNVLKALYTDMRATVEVGGERTEPFDVTNGLRQGCVISCVLFNLYFDQVVREALAGYKGGVNVNWREDRPPMGPGKRKKFTASELIADLRFADDLMNVAQSSDALQDFIDRFSEACTRWGLTVSIKKTQVMHQPGRDSMAGRCTVVRPSTVAAIEGKALEEVPVFTYLGSAISNDSEITTEVKARIAKASKCWGVLRGPVFKSTGLSVKAKLAVFKGAVLSSLLYGAETWAVKQGHVHMLEGFVATCLRQILQQPISKRMPDFVLFRVAEVTPIALTLRRMRLRWLGHVARMHDERMPKWMLYGELANAPTRPTCRPKQRWIDVIDRDLVAVGLGSGLKKLEWQALAKERTQWRSHVDKYYEDQRKAHYEEHMKQRLVRKRAVAALHKCPFPGCTFQHDQLRYIKSHMKQKHTEAALQRQQERATRVAATLPANMNAVLCPVCGKTLKCETTSVGTEWKGVRIHLAKAHKMDRQQQDTQIEQLGGIPRPARCTGGRTAGESLVGGEGGGEEERRGGRIARGRKGRTG